MPNAARVAQVLEWLALPVDRQPAIITLYFSDVDTAGHAYGPDSAQVNRAAAHLDRMLGDLIDGARRLNLMDRLNVVVVSDHGMSQLSDQRVIYLDDYIDISTVNVTEWSPNLGLAPRSGSVEAVYASLKGKHPSLAVYKREEIPAHLHYRNNPRIPPDSRPRGRWMEDRDARDGGCGLGGWAHERRRSRLRSGPQIDARPVRCRRSTRTRRRARAGVRERPRLQFSLCPARAETGAERRRSECDTIASTAYESLIPNPQSPIPVASPQSLEVLQRQHVTVTGSYAAAAESRSRP